MSRFIKHPVVLLAALAVIPVTLIIWLIIRIRRERQLRSFAAEHSLYLPPRELRCKHRTGCTHLPNMKHRTTIGYEDRTAAPYVLDEGIVDVNVTEANPNPSYAI